MLLHTYPVCGARKVNDVNDPRPHSSDRTPRRGDHDVPRRGDRNGAGSRRDNTSFGERRGKRYDGSDTGPQHRGRGEGPGSVGAKRGAHGAGGGPRGHDRQRVQGRPGQDARQAKRADEPPLPDEIEATDLDTDVRRDLRSLDKGNADAVARHLVAAMYLVDDDPVQALTHGRAAKNRAGRIGVVRETLGVLAYRAGEWAEALGELRAARRISGGPGLLAMMADCERGLRRPEKAVELARGEESHQVTGDDLIELRIVEAGARVDMGQLDAALVTVQDAGLDSGATGEEAARLDYAFAEILLASGRKQEAAEWFGHAVTADPEQTTDAEARLAELED